MLCRLLRCTNVYNKTVNKEYFLTAVVGGLVAQRFTWQLRVCIVSDPTIIFSYAMKPFFFIGKSRKFENSLLTFINMVVNPECPCLRPINLSRLQTRLFYNFLSLFTTLLHFLAILRCKCFPPVLFLSFSYDENDTAQCFSSEEFLRCRVHFCIKLHSKYIFSTTIS